MKFSIEKRGCQSIFAGCFFISLPWRNATSATEGRQPQDS